MCFKSKLVTQLLHLDSSSKASLTPVNQHSGKSFTNRKNFVVSLVVIPKVFWSLGEEKSCKFFLTLPLIHGCLTLRQESLRSIVFQ